MFFERYASGPLEVNTYILAGEEKKAVVIDPANAKKLLGILERNGLTLTHVLLTHGHFDHISAIKELKAATSCLIAAHQSDAHMLTKPNRNLRAMMHVDEVQVAADIMIQQGRFAANDLEFEVIHTPGHTPGGVCYLIDGMLFSGDTMFYRDIGRCDFADSDFGAMRRSIERLFELPDETRVYPGHMRETTIGYERKAGAIMEYFK